MSTLSGGAFSKMRLERAIAYSKKTEAIQIREYRFSRAYQRQLSEPETQQNPWAAVSLVWALAAVIVANGIRRAACGTHWRSFLLLAAAAVGLVACTSDPGTSTVTSTASTTNFAYPLKASPNQRYLVDQNNVPFLILGDSPQSMMVNLSTGDHGDVYGRPSSARIQCDLD